MILNNMMIVDRLRYDDLKMFTAICNMDYVIIREEDNTYTFLKNRYNGICFSGLTEYQLNEKLNDIVIGIIPEKKEVS